MASVSESPAESVEQGSLTEPLLPLTTGVTPDQKVVPTLRVIDDGSSSTQGLAISVVILAKTILGAGKPSPKLHALLSDPVDIKQLAQYLGEVREMQAWRPFPGPSAC